MPVYGFSVDFQSSQSMTHAPNLMKEEFFYISIY